MRRGAQFNWAKFRVFCQVEDDSQRLALMTDAAKNAWTTDHLIDRVRALNATLTIESGDGSNSATPTANLLKPNRGTPGVYRVATVEGALVVDLGFACYFDLSEEQEDGIKEGALVQLDGNGRISAADGATKADLFNYRVEIIRVVDGDTLWVKIYLRPRQWLKQKLRLRGLDCPEMKMTEGKAAKRFVDALVAKTTAVTINTTKPDKYDHYLADVFLELEPGSQRSAVSDQPLESPVFLNNALLENGQAVRKNEWEFGDWDSYFAKAT